MAEQHRLVLSRITSLLSWLSAQSASSRLFIVISVACLVLAFKVDIALHSPNASVSISGSASLGAADLSSVIG